MSELRALAATHERLTSYSRRYEATRHYPIVPRYSLLKDMIKTILRSPAFAEVCHENDEW